MTYKKIIYARISLDDFNTIKNACKLRGENLSIFIRRSILHELNRLNLLDGERKRFLEIKNENES